MESEQKIQGRRRRRTVGLDCHPDSFTAGVLVGERSGEAQVEKLTGKLPLEQLEEWALKHTEVEDTLVMEATGNCWELVKRLEEVGRGALVLDSVKVGKVAKSYCTTDKTSAVKIARVYLSGLGGEIWVPDPLTRARREVFSAYLQAWADAVRATNRLKGYLNEHCIRLPKGANLNTPRAQRLIWAARRWTPAQELLLRQGFADLAQGREKQAQLKELMAREILQTPELLQLLRIFGLRHIAVYAIAAYIGEIRRFGSPKKLVAYIGLNPRVDQSGEHDGRRFLSGQGRKELRRILVQAAHCIFHHNRAANPLYKWAHHLSFRKGRKVAAIAVARKIVNSMWYLLMGMFSPLAESTSTLRYKIRVLARFIGIQELRRLGYRRYDDYIDEKMEILRLTT
jgi:transposase